MMSAGHAVALVAAATPSTKPAAMGCGRRHSRARPSTAGQDRNVCAAYRQRERDHGGSCHQRVQRSTSRAPEMASAARDQGHEGQQNQIRGSSPSPARQRPGNPNRAMAGR